MLMLIIIGYPLLDILTRYCSHGIQVKATMGTLWSLMKKMKVLYFKWELMKLISFITTPS